MKRIANFKILIVIMVTVFITTIVIAQKPVVKTAPKASTGSVQKTSPIKKVIQKPDTIQITANVLADAIRDVILGYYKNNLMMASGILITQEYALKVNISLDKQGSLKIVAKNDTIIIKGNAKMRESGKMGFVMKTKNGSSMGSANDNKWVSNDDMVACINGGEINCAGYYMLKESIPVYFESGQIIFTDNEKSGTFSEGSVFVYNSISYIYTNNKWIKKG